MDIKIGDTVERTKGHMNDRIMIGDRDIVTKVDYSKNTNVVLSIQLSHHGNYFFTANSFKIVTPKIKTHELWV